MPHKEDRHLNLNYLRDFDCELFLKFKLNFEA